MAAGLIDQRGQGLGSTGAVNCLKPLPELVHLVGMDLSHSHAKHHAMLPRVSRSVQRFRPRPRETPVSAAHTVLPGVTPAGGELWRNRHIGLQRLAANGVAEGEGFAYSHIRL
jgi:hypothetical protein